MTRAIHVKIGIFISDMPGARMLRAVTIRLTAPVSDAMPVIWRPSAQKSMPCDGENTTVVFGAYANHPPSGAPPRNHDKFRKMPPNRKHQ